MPRSRRRSWAPVIVPAIVVILAVSLALLIGDGVWMTTLLVIGLIALAFALVSFFSRIP